MCRDNNHGGRRCSKEPAKHRAENRAAYGAQTAATLSAQVLEKPVETAPRPVRDTRNDEDHIWGYVTVPDDNLLSLEWKERDIMGGRVPAVSHREEMMQAVTDVKALLEQSDPMFIEGYVSRHGWRVESEVRRLGHLIGIEVEVERQRLEALYAAEHNKTMAVTREEQEAHLANLRAAEEVYLDQIRAHDEEHHSIDYDYEGWEDKEVEPGTPEAERKAELARLSDERRALGRLMMKEHDEWYKYKKKYEEYWKSVGRLRPRATVNVLRTIREMGGTVEVLDEYSSNRAKEELNEVTNVYYPTDWVEVSNSSEHPLLLSESSPDGRAAYMHAFEDDVTWKNKEGVVTPLKELTGEKGTAILSGPFFQGRAAHIFLHEFAHRIEHVYKAEGAQIVDLEEIFIQRRTTDGSGNRDNLIPFTPPGGEYIGEKVRPDHFANAYIGKAYDIYEERSEEGKKFREVLSMGMESIFSGTNGYLVGDSSADDSYTPQGYRKDLGHRAFILGLLAAR